MKDKIMQMCRENKGLILLAGIFALFPLACAWIYCLKDGRLLTEVYLPASYWNDELMYYKQVESVVNYGLSRGWFGFNEAHGSVYPFAAWSPVILIPWVLWGLVFGWNLHSPIYANIVANMLALAAFALLLRPKRRQALWILAMLAVFTPYTRFMVSGMPEALFMASGILLVALTVSYGRKEKLWKLGLLFGIVIFLTLARPYLGLLFLIPVWFAVRRKVPAGAAVSVVIVAVTALGYIWISKACSSPYIEPIIETDWLKLFVTDGPGAGLSYIWQTLLDKFLYLLDYYVRRAVKYGLFAGGLYIMAGLTAGLLLLRFFWARKKKTDGEQRVFFLFQFVTVAGMFFALFLFYRMGEGAKHLMIFIVMSLLWMALAEEKFHLMKLFTGICCLYFFAIKAWVPFDWQIAYDDGIMKAEAESLQEQLQERMEVVSSEDRYDNTVIWLASDIIDGESITASWGLLYMVPEGFGINFCTQVYVMEHIDELQSAYIAVLPGGEVEEAILERGAILFGATERMCMYRLR